MTQISTELILVLRQTLNIDLPESSSMDELKEKLSAHINRLIQTDFEKLVGILYRMDINEPKLKLLLKENTNSNAGVIIANLMIERQEQKIKSRQQFSKRDDNNISDEEKW